MTRPPYLEDCGNRRAIRRARAHMMEPHDARGIDEHIATELSRVGARVFRQPATRELSQVRQPRSASPDVPQPSPVHAVAAVQRAVAVDENRPGNVCVRQVRAHERRGFECDHRDADRQILERLLVLLQLQQVPAARESSQVPVKDQQEPIALVVAEPVCAPVRIRQFERNRRCAGSWSLQGAYPP